jgi:glutamate N-acetyltransferase/amino-acid N-acetyltransferase
MDALTYVEGGIVAPKGFLASGVSAGIKPSGRKDVAIVSASRPVPVAGVYTQNAMAASSVAFSRTVTDSGQARAVVVNAGNANACTGKRGAADTLAMAEAAADALDASADDIVVASTGVIGVPMPMDAVAAGIEDAAAALDNASGDPFAEAIMTTDTFVKQLAVTLEVDDMIVTVGGVAKGSGMIEPDMATMLGFITTDAPLSSTACAVAIERAVGVSFNRITVDGDTSTNDMCVLMASGEASVDTLIEPHEDGFAQILSAITHVAQELAKMVARDGEGATKLVEVAVAGAASDSDADAAAREIANSPLVKTAVFGTDPNWGRIVMALGNSAADIDPNAVDVKIAGVTTCRGGMAVDFDHAEAVRALGESEVTIEVELHQGERAATVWTCDFSYDYVRINAEYTT